MRKIFLILLLVVVVIAVVAGRMSKTGKIQVTEKPVATVPSKKCPDGYIEVSDFCVMKYDAKCSNPNPKCVTNEGVYKNNAPGCACQRNFKVVSTPGGAPITFIPEEDGTDVSAKAYCKNLGGHLMTNPEWMTIADDVAEVPANWCDKNGTNCGSPPGSIGKILANGHNDSTPSRALESGPDSDPTFGTLPNPQKRTLTLSNGEVIWDFAGNVWQWVDAEIARKGEPRSIIPGLGGIGWVWDEFQTVKYDSSYMPPNPEWNSGNGVGRIYHYNSIGDKDSTIYTYIKGGNWRHGADSGAFSIHMQPVPGKTGIDDVGFRCVM
jgi:hypothetical protein